ncbi:MAG: GreA/GreB family elongation factor [Patescibacteria group bacterium]
MGKQKVTQVEYDALIEDLKEAQGNYNQAMRQKGEAHGESEPFEHENFAAEEARRQITMWSRKIGDIEIALKNTIIVEKPDNNETVQLGHIVTLLLDDKERIVVQMGGQFARRSKGQLSNASLIGAAVFGQRVGTEINVETPGGKTRVKILAIK